MKKRLIICFFVVMSLCIFAADINGNYSNFLYYGSGTKINNEIRMTTAGSANVGAVWSKHLFDLSKDFTMDFEIYLGNSDAGADGAVFFFKPKEYKDRYFSVSGGQLGYGGTDTGGVIFQKTFGIQFDTYQNSEHGDPSEDHIAFVTGGDITGTQVTTFSNMEDGQWHNVTVNWDAVLSQFSYTFDGTAVTYSGDITTILGSTLGYFGFTASTGEQYNEQKIKNVVVTGSIPDTEYKLKIDQEITSGKQYTVGKTLEYEIVISNLGTEVINDLILTSNTGVNYLNWIQGSSLAGGEVKVIQGEKVATYQDVLNGTIIDTVTIEGIVQGGEQVSDAAEARATATSIEFEVNKSVTNTIRGSDGELQLEYTFEIINTGQETLTDLTVNDPKISGGITMNKTTIPSGEKASGTAVYRVTQSDINVGEIVNTATFAVKSTSGSVLEKEATNTYTLPTIDDFAVNKRILRGTNFAYVGEVIEYVYEVENVGNRTLSSLEITDPGVDGTITLDKTTILSGETARGTGIRRVTQEDLDAGEAISTARFNVTTLGGGRLEKVATIKVPGTPIDNFEVRKMLLKGEGFSSVGDEIEYSFEIENTGNRTLTNLVVRDSKISEAITLDKNTILPGETAQGTGVYVITQEDINTGEVTSTATFTGISPSGSAVQKRDTVKVEATLADNFEVRKKIVRGNNFISVGDEIEYSFEIENTGNTTLMNLEVIDPKISSGIALDKPTILPGEVSKGTGVYRVIQNDLDEGEVINTAIFNVTTSRGMVLKKQASVSSSGFNFGDLDANVKSAPKEVSYGSNLRYTIEVINNGTSEARNLTVYDNISGIKNKRNENLFTNIRTLSVKDNNSDVPYSGEISNTNSNLIISSIGAGRTVTVTLEAQVKDSTQITLTGGEQIKNQVLVTGIEPFDDGPLYPMVLNPTLSTVHEAITEDGDTIIEPNEKTTYTIIIENNSSLRVEDVSIIDKLSEITNLNGDYVFNRASTSDIKVVDRNGVEIPFIYDSSKEEITVSEINANNKVVVAINATVKNIKFTEKEKILNKAIVNGMETTSNLIAGTGSATDLRLKKSVLTTGGDNVAELDDLITYTIEVTNTNANTTLKELIMTDSLHTLVNGRGEIALENIAVTRIDSKERAIVRKSFYQDKYEGSLTIPTILPNETLVIEIQANLNKKATFTNNEVLDTIANIDFLKNINSKVFTNRDLGQQDGAPIVVVVPNLYVEKTSEKSKIVMGEDVLYKIKVSNNSNTPAKNIRIKDAVSQIKGNTVEGKKEAVFTTWSWKVDSENFKNKIPGVNTDLNIDKVTLEPDESVIFELAAKTNPNIIDASFENTAIVTEGLTGEEKRSTFKIDSSNAQIIVSKFANKREVKRGEFVTYTIKIENPNDVPIKNLKIVDTPPAGFEYMKGSSRFIKKNEKSKKIEPLTTKPLIYESLSKDIGIEIGSRETFEITYMLKVGIGVRNGEAENRVVVKSSLNEIISNTGKALVEVVDDPLFDSTTIIGKVFNDVDGNGSQEAARAEDVSISLKGQEFTYTEVLNGVSMTKKVVDNVFTKHLGEGDELILIFEPKEELWKINVKTKSGTDITLTDTNKIITNHSKNKKRGSVNEDISFIRKPLKIGGKNFEVITIVNNGREEKGIPGVRLMTIDGLVIETDKHGRFHVPPVKKSRGNSYLIKLDISSLPPGSNIVTENPKVKRLTRSMTKFNYGVVLPEQRDRVKKKEMVINVGEAFFKENSADMSFVQEKNLEILAKKLKKYQKGTIIISWEGSEEGLKALGLIRSSIIRDKLKELLGEAASNLEIRLERGEKND